MSAISEMQKIGEDSLGRDRSSASEVVVICNPRDFYFTACYRSKKDNLTYPMLNEVCHCLFRSGAPFDIIIPSDLKKIDPLKYKVYIFLGDFFLSSDERKLIEEKVKTNNHLVVWIYSPGYIDENSLSAENICSLTGITIKQAEQENTCQVEISVFRHPLTKPLSAGTGADAGVFRFGIAGKVNPVFYAEDAGAENLGRIAGTERTGFCVKKFPSWTSLYCFAPPVSTSLLRSILSYAGVHIYNDKDDVLYANKSYLCVNTREGGRRLIRLPEKSDVFDLFGSSPAGKNTREFEVVLPPRSIHLYLLTPPLNKKNSYELATRHFM